MNKRERFSKQLARSFSIIRCLEKQGPSTIKKVGAYLVAKHGFEVCNRTVMRDLETLVACGFVTCSRSMSDNSFVYDLSGNVANDRGPIQ